MDQRLRDLLQLLELERLELEVGGPGQRERETDLERRRRRQPGSDREICRDRADEPDGRTPERRELGGDGCDVPIPAVADVAVGKPLNGVLDVAGPDAYPLDELGRIALAARAQRIALGIGVLCLYVLAFNRLLWRRLYDIAAERLRLD